MIFLKRRNYYIFVIRLGIFIPGFLNSTCVETISKISANMKKKHENIPWKEMKGIRNRLIHEYFGVDLDIVWIVVNEDLPRVLPLIKELIEK
ncbi:MAG: DUF86 domain-containing protein [Thermotogae bacterium]|nr:DUF86 domain-containing protein [Thermotogota bacterium]